MSTPLPETRWTPLWRWSSKEAQALHQKMLHEANVAAHAAAMPYLKEAERIFNACATLDHVVLDRTQLIAGLDAFWLSPKTPAPKD